MPFIKIKEKDVELDERHRRDFHIATTTSSLLRMPLLDILLLGRSLWARAKAVTMVAESPTQLSRLRTQSGGRMPLTEMTEMRDRVNADAAKRTPKPTVGGDLDNGFNFSVHEVERILGPERVREIHRKAIGAQPLMPKPKKHKVDLNRPLTVERFLKEHDYSAADIKAYSSRFSRRLADDYYKLYGNHPPKVLGKNCYTEKHRELFTKLLRRNLWKYQHTTM